MKAIWKGSLTVGLISLDIELYSATKSHPLQFKLLHSACHTPINYKRWCAHDKREIPWDEVVKGLKISAHKYVVLDKKLLQTFKPAKSSLMNIHYFVKTSQIPLLFFANHYYVTPKIADNPAFSLFVHALEDKNSSAIATFVMKEKEHVCALSVYQGVLILSTLHYAYEINKPPHIATKHKSTKKEFDLAAQLITSLTNPTFDISKFKDTFLNKLIQNIKKRKPARLPKTKQIKAGLSLTESLEQSIMQTKKIKKK